MSVLGGTWNHLFRCLHSVGAAADRLQCLRRLPKQCMLSGFHLLTSSPVLSLHLFRQGLLRLSGLFRVGGDSRGDGSNDDDSLRVYMEDELDWSEVRWTILGRAVVRRTSFAPAEPCLRDTRRLSSCFHSTFPRLYHQPRITLAQHAKPARLETPQNYLPNPGCLISVCPPEPSGVTVVSNGACRESSTCTMRVHDSRGQWLATWRLVYASLVDQHAILALSIRRGCFRYWFDSRQELKRSF